MPFSCASMIPSLTPEVRPKSSALTIRYLRAAIRETSNLIHQTFQPKGLQAKPIRQTQGLAQPVLGMLAGGRPVARPTQPLHRLVQPAAIQLRQERLPSQRPSAVLFLGEIIG